MDDAIILVDRQSFPKKCPELFDFLALLGNVSHTEVETENPNVFFRKALELAEEHELVIPLTRNFYVRERLRQEGVSLIICL